MKKEEIKVGDVVLVEQCWEDEGGNYHDEYAHVVSIEPFKLKFENISKEVEQFLDTCEFSPDDVETE